MEQTFIKDKLEDIKKYQAEISEINKKTNYRITIYDDKSGHIIFSYLKDSRTVVSYTVCYLTSRNIERDLLEIYNKKYKPK